VEWLALVVIATLVVALIVALLRLRESRRTVEAMRAAAGRARDARNSDPVGLIREMRDRMGQVSAEAERRLLDTGHLADLDR
jgi:hypothetical protein